ncbi:multidrug transporter subunit MdtN [Cupriavidus neocaledonicus]|uniref:Hemolysin D n=1 Tax=Cupriavidus neocaledonicus TaxID=1040979 RepID=A0A375H8U0_9BURK|nr:multidrug transporter subunit MdtN [Cupriavidus neocaledonicus]SOZ34930.1 Multidrug resistance protein MdtN [Cupriavidus neocaledonicus]SPD46873.1 Hemolysin D [Cupriavidus neocaledonicus]
MKMAGMRRGPWRGKVVAVVIVALAVALSVYAYQRTVRYPSTDDATLDADLIHVAAPVGGRIARIAVAENQRVARGDVLFEIDPVPYQLTLAQARADLELAKAMLGTRRRTIGTERGTASVAAEQIARAEQNYALTQRTVERLRPLAADGYVPKQQLDQAEVARRDAAVTLKQAQLQQATTAQAVGSEDDALATVRAREAALAIAQRALDDTVVRAPFAGRVSGLRVLAGEVVLPNQSLFLLVHTGEWFAMANFRETQLAAIRIGDCATVYSMIDRRTALRGTVAGIGVGIGDTDRINLPRSLPYVQPSVNWVRVAHRFPVRIQLEEPPEALARVGASAIVEVRHGAACR